MSKCYDIDKVVKFKATYYDGVIEGSGGLPFFIAIDDSGFYSMIDMRISVYENRGKVFRLYHIPYLNDNVFYMPANCWFTNDGDPPDNVLLIESRKQAEKVFSDFLISNMTSLVRWYVMFILLSLVALGILFTPLQLKYKIITGGIWCSFSYMLSKMTADSKVIHIRDLSGKRYRFEVKQ